jgi:hypothetical protein
MFDELDMAVDRVSGYLKSSSEYAISLEKQVIGNLISSKGDEEKRSYSGPVDDVLSLIALGVGIYMDYYFDRKIEYVQLLFSMIPVLYWRQFYGDLRFGLDNVIRLWDASEEDPHLHFFSKPPTEYVKRVTWLKAKRKH